MTAENTSTDPSTSPSVEAPLTPTVVNIEYTKELTHKDLPYPTEDKLQSKIEDALQRPVWRIHIKRKDTKPVPLNQITFKGIDAPHQVPSVDSDDLQQTILGICYEDVRRRDTKATYWIVCNVRTPPGKVQARVECSISLSPDDFPKDEGRDDDERRSDGHDDSYSRRHEEDEAEARRQRLERIRRYTERGQGDFVESHSPFSDTSRARREQEWRGFVLGGPTPPSRPDNYDRGSLPASLEENQRQLFSTDMEMRFDPNRLPPHVQQDYLQAVMPFQMLNNAMALSMKGMAASFDMIVAANREQAAQHALQMQGVYDRERQLMAFPMQFLRIEADQKQHTAELLQKSHDQYVDSLRMRGEMNNRELGYQQQNLHNQYSLAEQQRQMQEQVERHQKEKTETWRRDLLRGIAPMALQGLGLFLDYFGQQKAGAAARMSGSVVEGIFSTIEQQEAQQGGAPPQRPPSPPQGPGQGPNQAPPRPPTQGPPGPPSPHGQVIDVPSPTSPIPRRTLRVADFASIQEMQAQPLRTLCRMADTAFSSSDRHRLRQVLTDAEVEQLEHALRGQSDSECMNNLGMFMFTVARDEDRKQRMLAMFTPGQNELLNMIGDVMQGKVSQIDPNYEVEIRPPRSRMRAVMRESQGTPAAPSQTSSRIPVPPQDLDGPRPATRAHRVPVPPPDIDSAAVPTPTPPPDIPRPSVPSSGEAPPDVPRPTSVGSPPDQGIPEQVQSTLVAIQEQIASMQAQFLEETKRLKAQIDGPPASTKPRRKATSKSASKPRKKARRAPKKKASKPETTASN